MQDLKVGPPVAAGCRLHTGEHSVLMLMRGSLGLVAHCAVAIFSGPGPKFIDTLVIGVLGPELLEVCEVVMLRVLSRRRPWYTAGCSGCWATWAKCEYASWVAGAETGTGPG